MKLRINKGLVDIEYEDYAVAFISIDKDIVMSEWFRESPESEDWNSPWVITTRFSIS